MLLCQQTGSCVRRDAVHFLCNLDRGETWARVCVLLLRYIKPPKIEQVAEEKSLSTLLTEVNMVGVTVQFDRLEALLKLPVKIVDNVPITLDRIPATQEQVKEALNITGDLIMPLVTIEALKSNIVNANEKARAVQEPYCACVVSVFYPRRRRPQTQIPSQASAVPCVRSWQRARRLWDQAGIENASKSSATRLGRVVAVRWGRPYRLFPRRWGQSPVVWDALEVPSS